MHLPVKLQAQIVYPACEIRSFELHLMDHACSCFIVEERRNFLTDCVIDFESYFAIAWHGELNRRRRVKRFGKILAECKDFRDCDYYLHCL